MVTCRPQCHGFLWPLEALPCQACSHHMLFLLPLICGPWSLNLAASRCRLVRNISATHCFPAFIKSLAEKTCWGRTSQRMFGLLLHPIPLLSGPRAVHLGWPAAAGPREGYYYTSLPHNSDASPSDVLNNPKNASVFPIIYYLGIETWLNIGFIFLKTQSHGRCCVLSLGGPQFWLSFFWWPLPRLMYEFKSFWLLCGERLG